MVFTRTKDDVTFEFSIGLVNEEDGCHIALMYSRLEDGDITRCRMRITLSEAEQLAKELANSAAFIEDSRQEEQTK